MPYVGKANNINAPKAPALGVGGINFPMAIVALSASRCMWNHRAEAPERGRSIANLWRAARGQVSARRKQGRPGAASSMGNPACLRRPLEATPHVTISELEERWLEERGG